MVLFVGAGAENRAHIRKLVGDLGYRTKVAKDGAQAVARLLYSPGEISAILVDTCDPAVDDVETLRRIREIDAEIPVTFICSPQSPPQPALNQEGTDVLFEPITLQELQSSLSITTNVTGGHRSCCRTGSAQGRAFMGNSPAMAAIETVLNQIAASDAPVLIQGETGSGKEVLARELHANSQRRNRPFVKLNCAALPSELVESELFGYEKGAFTGAFQRKPGMFEAADGGTIMLDEIGDMDVRLQAKLLQVLQDHSFQRIGGRDTIKVDVRVIAATHCDLEKAIPEKRFREDLYYRLNVINLMVPPLRDRKEDLLELAETLIRKHLKTGDALPFISPELQTAMLSWHWPGNVRELENFVRKLIIFRDSAYLVRELEDRAKRRSARTPVESVAAELPACVSESLPRSGLPLVSMEEVAKAERQAQVDAILHALNTARWNRKTAAALLQMDYKALLYKMKKLGIEGGCGSGSAGGAEENGEAVIGRSSGSSKPKVFAVGAA